MNISVLFSIMFIIAFASTNAVAKAPPREWIDKDTGHRVLRLSEEDNQVSFYFHQNAYTVTGDKMVFYSPKGILTYDFKSKKSDLIVKGNTSHAVVAKKSRKVYYLIGDTVFETDIDTKVTREILRDGRLGSGSGFAINSDETLLGGSMITGKIPKEFVDKKSMKERFRGKGEMMSARITAKIPMALYTIGIQTGLLNTFHNSTDWLNHVQFSPTDPCLMMFCHEGAWDQVDRIWTIRTDGSDLRKIHIRSSPGEIAGHEFFSPDGRFIYYDLQTPAGKEFWLARHDIRSGRMDRFALEKREWSVHYSVSPDGSLFSGDGGGPKSVAKGDNGQWIYLFRPKGDKLVAERLVNLSNHDYGLEPNATFTPDGKWLVFRSNMFGAPRVYAVEIEKMSR